MFDADEDEDVVFEGSAIHQHLQSTGYSDYEITQTVLSQRPNSCCLEDSKPKIEWALLKKKLFDAITLLFWPKGLRRSFYKRIPKQVYESRLQNSDDLLLVKHFVPHTFVSPDRQSDRSITLEIFFWCIRGVLLSAVVILCLLLFIGESARWSSIILAPAFTAVIWIVTVSWMLYKSVVEVENFVKILQEIAQLLSKSLRLLLEEDLVSRGFVLAQGSSSFISSDGREAPHCEGLRQALHNTLNATLPVLCSVHEYLNVVVCHYPCIRGLFDDILDIDTQEKQNSYEHLKFLKKLVTLVKLQMSAVVTELVLCAADEEVFEQVLDRHNIFTSHLVTQVKKEVDLLFKHLTYAQSFWQKDVENEMQESICEEKKKNVYIAIHSLTLHMQAALFRVQDLEKKFEALESTSNGLEANVGTSIEMLPSYEFVKEQLNSIQIELQSCQGCLDETAVRVDRKYAIKEEDETKPDLENSVNIGEDVISVVATKKPPIPLFELGEPVIKDEVFEAYIDQEYCSSREKEIKDDFWNTDAKRERQKLRQQKAQGKRVLHELQPVLNKLREVWEERETAALQRQRAEVSQGMLDNGVLHDKTRMPPILPTTKKMDFENRDTDNDGERLQGFRKEEKQLDVGKTNSENLQPVTSDTFEDSDDERLEAYRKVKRELDMDEKSSTVDTVEDSDDERLEIYKRVRMELDKDEKCETLNSMSLWYDTGEQAKVKFCLPSATGLVTLQSVVSENEVSFDDSNVQQTVSDSEVGCDDSIVQQTKDEENLSVQTLLNNYKSRMDTSGGISALSATKSEMHMENIAPIFNLKSDDNETSLSKDLEEEVFVHGEDIDDNDFPRIDWSTVTLPIRMTETLEDRMQLFCGGQNRGFHAELAAEAQAASHQFLNKGNTAETFRGVGEGEEVFGDEDSE